MDAKQKKLENDTLFPMREHLRGKTCWDFFNAAAQAHEEKKLSREDWTRFLEHAVTMALTDALCTIDPMHQDEEAAYFAAVGRSMAFLQLFGSPSRIDAMERERKECPKNPPEDAK